jgi:general transcription factor 3C polypeptide 3 (transcription factor C subunit 4)
VRPVQAMGKKVPDRNRVVLQGFAFLSAYQRARRDREEAAYNLGRAAHQLGMLHIAVAFYELALRRVPL